MLCWYQVVCFIYLIAQFFIVFEQGPLLEVVEVRNNRGQEYVTLEFQDTLGPCIMLPSPSAWLSAARAVVSVKTEVGCT